MKIKPMSLEAIKKIFSNYYDMSHYVVIVPRTKEGLDGRLVSCVDKTSYIAEQYKVLRTNLASLSPEKAYKTFVITSAQPQEGKTITSCNLAATLAMDREKKVVLLDADMRRPAVHSIFGIQRKPGLSDVLSGKANIDEFIRKPMHENLYIVPAGSIHEDTSSILISNKISGIIEKLKKSFDYIIFDTPPVLNVTDSSILGSMVDAVLLVVKAGVTQQASIEEAFNMLEGAQAKPKACILTNVHFMLDTYSYYTKYLYRSYKYQSPEVSNSSPDNGKDKK